MGQQMKDYAILTHEDCLRHEMPGHPERPERLQAILDRLAGAGVNSEFEWLQASALPIEKLGLVHPDAYNQHIIKSEPVEGLIKVDPDTYMCNGSVRAARLAAGACVEGVEKILAADFKRVFCAVRPPGHHAEIAEAMGFCLFNSIALAAETALQHPDFNRIAILDFDVHHCNGTVDIFKDRSDVLVCSTFQDDFYPNRYLDFNNNHIVSCPLAAGSTGDNFRQVIESRWLPAISAFKPDLILVSAGFDAHQLDPLGQLMLTEADYEWVTRLICDLSNDYCQGRLLSTLEGGYHLDALAACTEVHLATLLE